MGRKHLTFEEYKSRFPEESRSSIELLEKFYGNRTRIAFTFGCGCREERCLKEFLLLERLDFCPKCKPKERKVVIESDDSEKFIGKIKDIDFVVCNVCGRHAKKLTRHLREKHNINVSDYNGKAMCESSLERYSAMNKGNGNWVDRAKERGDDLTEYKQKMGQAVRAAILSNPEDRKRRAEVMSKVNKSDVMRKKASETAIKTSARKDIQEARALKLKNWRDENPDDFYEKCISKMMGTYNSKPESLLYELVKNTPGYNLKRHRKVRSDKFNNYKQRDIDIGDSDKRLYIEFDGALHFKQTSLNQLDSVQEKDRLFDEHVNDNNWVLIRISYDQFSYRKSDYGFSKECLDYLFSILRNPMPGVHKIGKAYKTPLVENNI